jgi:chromosome partition protein MukB
VSEQSELFGPTVDPSAKVEVPAAPAPEGAADAVAPEPALALEPVKEAAPPVPHGRARATALALVNWKGVFYERYLLDRHVTALEGANGAGKTTVMVAAYVVLLPDLQKLRFTNLGETGATGGDRGLYGRLGESGRPSYAVMEITVAGEQLLLGVMLERKAEPAMELTTFLVTGLALEGTLKPILLATEGDQDAIPELAEVRARVEALGGTFRVFGSAKEYFTELFDRGITPLRLSTEEERSKMNEMLRTSMTGGISRALTTDLRGFLLKEDQGLSSTLARMRQSLDTCQRTRVEVREASVLEREVRGIYEAASAMFFSHVAAARLRSEEAAHSVQYARSQLESLDDTLRELNAALAEHELRDRNRRSTVAALVGERDIQGQRVRALERAWEAEQELARLRVTEQKAREEREVAREARDRAAAARETARREQGAAQEEVASAALGLASFQDGLSGLHRRADLERQAALRQAEAAQGLCIDPAAMAGLGPADREQRLSVVTAELEAADRAYLRARRRREMAALEAGERSAAELRLVALEEALFGGPSDAPPQERARAALDLASTLETEGARAGLLLADAERARQEAADGARILARVSELIGNDETDEQEDGDLEEVLRAEVRSEDRELATIRERTLGAEHASARARADVVELTARIQAADGAGLRWRAALPAWERLQAWSGESTPTREAISRMRSTLGDRRDEVLRALRDAEAARKSALSEAERLGDVDGGVSEELERLRIEASGELLMHRFDEVDLARAAILEANLGPMMHAIVVSDPAAAARALRGQPRDATEVRLVAEDAVDALEAAAGAASDAPSPQSAPADDPASAVAPDLEIAEPWGMRIVRLPTSPALGRAARAARAEARRGVAEAAQNNVHLAFVERDRLDALIADADACLSAADVLQKGDPRKEEEALAASLHARERSLGEYKELASALAEARSTHAARKEALEELSRDVRSLRLAVPSFGSGRTWLRALAARARVALDAATRASEARTRAELATPLARDLAKVVDALGSAPSESDAEANPAELEETRERLTRTRDALAWLVRNPDATTESGAAAELAAGSALAPALESQMVRARARNGAADAALRDAEAAWEAATETYQRRSAAVLTLESEHERLHLARTSATTEPVSLPLVETARAALRTLARRAEDVEGDALRTARERATLEERRTRSAEERTRAAATLEAAEKAAEGPKEAWERLRAEAQTARLGHRIDARPIAEVRGDDHDATPAEVSSVAHTHEAQASRALLLDRLRSARGGAELADELEETRDLAKTYLAAVEWLMRRLPAFVAEGRDPAARLDELRAHLLRLEERLGYQERDLRGSSADIAATIEVRVRKASTQIRRLNQLLAGVAFGNISGIRVQSKRVERMEQVLRALREGKGQDLLFSGRLPLEEAMNELFKRYGGGRTGGVKLLDYREYMDLSVEIQRQGETKTWEVAAATRLSTGEAIGVGAALMMVVLSEWERDTALLRSRRAFGSLRFLFLDEANRLSRDNLAVLFSLCETLDLQLLIAAPEVATATGNTTYRLVRVVHDDGSEEVVVSGRRALPDLPIALPVSSGSDAETPPEAAAEPVETGAPDAPSQDDAPAEAQD